MAGLTNHQSTELRRATAGLIGILGGGPGTGKTYTVAELCKSLSTSVGLDHVAIGAPTGKAAVRVTETLQQAGVNLRARTWHSLLRGGTDGGFAYNRENPLPFAVLIGDESSMLDTSLMAAILRARPRGCLVLFVGDVNQLPPVGSGAPLRDLIAAGVPYGELTEIKRNSGGIVEACHAIRQGQRWDAGDNLQMFEHAEPEWQIKRMLQLLDVCRDEGQDPVWDCQVVAAVNAKSPLSRAALNAVLQAGLNPGGKKVGGNPFRVGDKIVNLKNNRYKAIEYDADNPDLDVSDREEVYVANGELARVLDVEPTSTVAQLENPRRVVRIPRGQQQVASDDAGDNGNQDEAASCTGCQWDLGYCLSVHKSQGSEWPVVITMLDDYPGARMVCDRSWLYTAISRAKDRQCLIGAKATADAMCRRNKIHHRKTFLKELIHVERAKIEMAEL